MEPDNPLLDQYILSVAGVSKPKVCFVGTASGDAQSYIDGFYEVFRNFDSIPSHLSLFKPPAGDLRSFVLQQDVIYVGGGSTRNLLVLWKEWGLDLILKEALASGVVLAGISAGSICWFEQGLTDSVKTGELHPLTCLGFLKGSNCPHYDGEPERRPAYQRFVRERMLKDGYAADDGVALHFIESQLATAVSSRESAKAYSVRERDGQIEETPLETRYLAAVAAA
jgi:peptidase E